MPVQATLFSRVLQHLPMAVLDRAVAKHGMDKGHRSLDARSHLVALIAGQMIEANGLRDIEAVLAAHAPSLKRRRIQPACKSTLADANKSRAPQAFEAVIPALLAQLSPTQQRLTHKDLRLIDSTFIYPGAKAVNWAQLRNGLVSAKVHVVFDPNAQAPTFYELTSSNINDISVAKSTMPVEAGATYVFDLGYYDFGFWAELSAQECRIVTRLKKNTSVKVLENRAVAPGGAILSDQTVMLPKRLAASRQNPYSQPARMVVVAIETGKVLRLFTNDLTSAAEEISKLYKTRWQIELFFRWIKQNLKIRRFHGRSENAVRLQIAAAIITYLLVKLTHIAAKTKKTAARLFNSLRHAMFQRIELSTLVERIERTRLYRAPPLISQMELAL